MQCLLMGCKNGAHRLFCTKRARTVVTMSIRGYMCASQAVKLPHCVPARAICRSSKAVHRRTLCLRKLTVTKCTTTTTERVDVLQQQEQLEMSDSRHSIQETVDTNSGQLMPDATAASGTNPGEEAVPYDAGQDWRDRFGHYDRYRSKVHALGCLLELACPKPVCVCYTCSKFKGAVALHTTWTPRQNLAGSSGQDEPAQQWHGLRAAKASGMQPALPIVPITWPPHALQRVAGLQKYYSKPESLRCM